MERTAATCVLHSFERYEKKYILTEAQYEAILPEIQKHTVMDVYGKYTICNIYYDTEHYDLIRQSLRKPYYKEKFRVRSYGVPGAGPRISSPRSKRRAVTSSIKDGSTARRTRSAPSLMKARRSPRTGRSRTRSCGS